MNSIFNAQEDIDHWQPIVLEEFDDMLQLQVEYKLVPLASGDWHVYRGALPIAIRHGIFDAAEIATFFAECDCVHGISARVTSDSGYRR